MTHDSTGTEFRPPNIDVWTHPENWRQVSQAAGLTLEQEAALAFAVLLDPDSTLPPVVLKADPGRSNLETGPWQGYDIFNTGAELLGYANLMFDYRDNNAYFAEIKLGSNVTGHTLVDKATGELLAVRGNGYGLGTYKKVIARVIEQGYGFKSLPESAGHGLSKDGYRMWKHMETAGVARVIQEGRIDPNANRFNYATHRFAIASPEELLIRMARS